MKLLNLIGSIIPICIVIIVVMIIPILALTGSIEVKTLKGVWKSEPYNGQNIILTLS